MTEITHLVVNGDSFTYCQGLEDRTEKGWPYLLARSLDCDVVNLALPGTGNDTIHRRTYEYAISAKAIGNHPFFIIAWSQFWRREVWLEKKKGYSPVGVPVGKVQNYKKRIPRWNNEFQYPFIKNFDEEDHARRTYLHKASLKTLFKSFNMPFLMSDYSSDSHLFDSHSIQNYHFIGKIVDFIDFVHGDTHLTPLCDLTLNLPKTGCGHDGLEGNAVVAEFLLEQIKKLYDPIKISSDNHVFSLEDFNNIYK